jgi:hypothetical protein
MSSSSSRRQALATLAASSLAALASGAAASDDVSSSKGLLLVDDAGALRELTDRLARAPRRRDFKAVPMILTRRDEWDSEALDLVLGYRGKVKQAFDNTELDGPWLNLMRNSMNAQIWSWKHPDFLCVSATHGTAHLALYDDMIWSKYRLAELTQDKHSTNTFVHPSPAGESSVRDFQKPDGAFSPADNNIIALQRRGAVFIGCHNAIWEVAAGRIKAGVNPDQLSNEAMAAEFTNHLVPGVVLSPGAIGTLPELERMGFSYAK